MKKNSALQISLLILLLNVSLLSNSFSQSWTVGIPVDMQLSILTHVGGGCYPTADFNFNFPGSQVTGVDYVYIVTSVPANTVYVNPGQDTLTTGDTLTFSPGNNIRSVFFFGGSGSVDFDFRAIGTPTTAGQHHACNAAPLWMSNLLICDEGLTNTLNNNDCTVQSATGTVEQKNTPVKITLPSSQNDFTLNVQNTLSFHAASVYDGTGKVIISQPINDNNSILIHCSKIKSGIYFLVLEGERNRHSEKFVLLRE